MDRRTLISKTRDAMKASAVFRGLPDHLGEKLSEVAVLERYDRSSVLIASGECTSFARHVIKGYSYLLGQSEEGRELQLARQGEGHWFGWVQVFSGVRARQDHWAAAGTEFIALPKSALLSVADEWPQLYRNAFLDTGRMVQEILHWVWTVQLSSEEKKVARLFLQMLPQNVATRGYSFSCSQSELASFFGVGRQALNRHLAVLEQNALIIRKYRQVEIPDIARLRAFSELHKPD